MWGLQKLGLILETKVVQKSSLEKNLFNKKWSPKLILLEIFLLEKIRLIFDIENLALFEALALCQFAKYSNFI